MKAEELKEILRLHKLWIDGDLSGSRANLSGAYLYCANLSGANLYRADLSGANLSDANLYRANPSGANLSDANLRGAYLYCANLSGANLSGASLSGANLRGANLSNANLRGASLSNANLSGAYLYCANLRNASGNMRQIKTISLETYHVTYTKDIIQIGCENHSIEEWRLFSDERIIKMDGKRALSFWRKHKDFIFSAIELSPAES